MPMADIMLRIWFCLLPFFFMCLASASGIGFVHYCQASKRRLQGLCSQVGTAHRHMSGHCHAVQPDVVAFMSLLARHSLHCLCTLPTRAGTGCNRLLTSACLFTSSGVHHNKYAGAMGHVWHCTWNTAVSGLLALQSVWYRQSSSQVHDVFVSSAQHTSAVLAGNTANQLYTPRCVCSHTGALSHDVDLPACLCAALYYSLNCKRQSCSEVSAVHTRLHTLTEG